MTWFSRRKPTPGPSDGHWLHVEPTPHDCHLPSRIFDGQVAGPGSYWQCACGRTWLYARAQDGPGWTPSTRAAALRATTVTDRRA